MRLRLLPLLLIVLAAFASLSGCASSPPTQFIALNAIPGTGAPIALAGPPIRLGEMQFPSELDQPYLVMKTGPNTREMSNTVRWIAPPEDLIRDTLGIDLADRLDSKSFIDDASASLEQNARVLIVSIETFMPDTHHRVELDARWQLISGAGSPNQLGPSGHATIKVTAKGSGAGAIAAAMSEALGRLSERILMPLEPTQAS